MHILVRPASEDDLSEIKRLYWQLDTDAVSYQPQHFQRLDRPDDFLVSIIGSPSSDFLLIEEDGSTVGFALVQEKQTAKVSCIKPENYLYILDFVIEETRRSRGLGKVLLDACVDWGNRRKLAFLRLSVFPENGGAIAFYEREGLSATMQTMERRLNGNIE